MNKKSDVQISLFNLQGKLEEKLYNGLMLSLNDKLTFDIQHLNLKPGLYFINISVDGALTVRKLIIR